MGLGERNGQDIYLEVELWVCAAVRDIVHFLFRQVFRFQFTSASRDSAGKSFCGCISVGVFFPISALRHRR